MLSSILHRICRAPAVHLLVLIALLPARSATADDKPQPLPATNSLTLTSDLSVLMRGGFEKFLLRELDASTALRKQHWMRDCLLRDRPASTHLAERG
jgi:hypothetical protein